MTDTVGRLQTTFAGRYVLDRKIGEGGMASVYLAQDIKHDRSVAIKVMRPELAASIGPERFLREIRVAALLQHPNILALYDSGEADGVLYYVMPFVEGESLRERLKREGQLGVADALRITREVAEALSYAHSRGVVHRDIKPENVLLLGDHALVADFGIARAVSKTSDEKLTETGAAIGTPYYMSPEQAHGGENVDGRSDLYSLGCVLYELLAGQPPFVGPNAMAILARHSLDAVPSLQIVRHSIPDDVEDAIMHALEKVPADRFATVQQFAEALAQAELGVSTRWSTQRPRPSAARRQPEVQRRRWLLAAAGLFVLIVAALAGTWAWRRSGGAATTSAPSGPDPRRLAVLYFEQRGGLDSLSYLADGLTEALIHELSEVKPLQVISQNGVRPYKKTDVAPDSIARALKVGTIVEGSVAQSGNRLRVNVSLVNAVTGAEIGSKTLERPREEIFALQDDLAKEVAFFLRQRLGQEITVRESRLGTRNAKAWEILQQAENLTEEVDPLLTSGDTAAAARRLAEADSALAKAQSLDPNWVKPIVSRGWIAYRETDLIPGFDKPYYSKWLGQGLEHAGRALRIQPNDPEALELRGTLEYWRWLINLEPDQAKAAKLLADAERDLRAAVAANVNAASAWAWLSHLLMSQSQEAEAKLAALRAYEADPYLSSVRQTLWRLFQTSLDLEDQQEATHWCGEGHRRFPNFHRFTECQIWLFALKGVKPDVPKAWQLFEQYDQLIPRSTREFTHRWGQMIVAMALARAGLADSAKRVAERARADAAIDPTRDLAQLEAVVHVILGDRDEALHLLSTYVAANPQFRATMARDEGWWWKDLRDDPRFAALAGGGIGSQ